MFRALSAPDDTTAPASTAPAGGRNPLTGATETTLPGLATFKGLVLGLIPYALVACVAAFLIGAILWAVGAFGHNPQHSSRGKTTLIVALVAALLVGGAAYLVGWFNNVGKTVSAPISVTQMVEPAHSFLSA
ncbi:MAG TPA: DUF6112 family protein [Nakamurella multipartita]|nr:DUF6112 family protein [Nakamurella multipartita]